MENTRHLQSEHYCGVRPCRARRGAWRVWEHRKVYFRNCLPVQILDAGNAVAIIGIPVRSRFLPTLPGILPLS